MTSREVSSDQGMGVSFHAARSVGVAKLSGNVRPLVLARAASSPLRHFGIEPDDFQLETVVGARSSAMATATVPPRSSINCSTVCMATSLRYS